MKKFLLWFLGIIVGLFVVVFVILFTPIGNALLKPILQSQIDKYAPIKLDLDTFSLGFSSVEVKITHNDKININLDGDFSLFTQKLDLNLKVDAKDISPLSELAGTNLQGSFIINSFIKGELNDLEINTTSDIAKSFTDIRVRLQEFAPTLIKATIKDADIAQLLAIAGQKPYVNALLNLDSDIKGDKDMNLNGNALLQINQGVVDSSLIEKDFEIAVPKTNFVITLNGIFDMDKLNHDFNFNSNIGNIHFAGESLLKTLSTDSIYSVNLSDLSAFTPLVGQKIRGSFNTNGSIKGDMDNMSVEGFSDVGDSKTTYNVNLKELALNEVKANINNMQVDTLLYMIYMPRYANMKLNGDVVASDFDKGISTNATIKLKGTTNNAVMKKEFDMDMPNTNFVLDSVVKLDKGIGEANSKLDSDIANINITPTKINLNDFEIATPYNINVPNLKKLKFATGVELAGDFKANGNFKLNDKMYVDFNTNSLDGNVNAVLNDNKFNAKLQNLNTLKAFSMLQLSPIFSSNINGDLNYDLLSSKGKLKATISNGKLMKGDLSELAAKYLKFDITKEIYEDASLEADINDKLINTDIKLKSANTQISSNDATLNLDKETIDANFDIKIKDKGVVVRAKNKLSSPDINIDASELIKGEALKVLDKQADKAIDKFLKDDKQKEGAKKLLNLLK